MSTRHKRITVVATVVALVVLWGVRHIADDPSGRDAPVPVPEGPAPPALRPIILPRAVEVRSPTTPGAPPVLRERRAESGPVAVEPPTPPAETGRPVYEGGVQDDELRVCVGGIIDSWIPCMKRSHVMALREARAKLREARAKQLAEQP